MEQTPAQAGTREEVGKTLLQCERINFFFETFPCNSFVSLQVQEMIQDALDALPETEDSDFKSNISLNELHGNGDQSSSSGNQQGVSQVDLALCLLADDEFLASQKN